jgi:hypothetical protein
MIGLASGSFKHWRIEDDVAGHCRGYMPNKIQSLMVNIGCNTMHVVGLKFPASNPLVNRSEKSKLSPPTAEKTKHLGCRNMKFKIYFSSLLDMILNKRVSWPLYMLQILFKKTDHAPVFTLKLN